MQSILKVCVAPRFMLHVPSEEQKENCGKTCQDMEGRLERVREFLLKILTGDDEMFI
jgi:hypothetical protein